jgi:carboxyl-terminal processing protease
MIQEYIIKRSIITLPSVTWNLDSEESRLGILKISRIAASTPDEIKQAITDLTKRGASHFVLDLRDNRGGLLTAGVDTARLFLDQGKVIQQEYRGQPVETFNVETPGPFINLPLAVLINHDTASAAEILAGALKVNKRADLIGMPTYGKDTIQLVFDLKDKSSLHITSAHWWIPGLEPPIDGHGIQPDIVIPEEAMNTRKIIEKTIEVLFGE